MTTLVAILTVSDRCSRGQRIDRSGPAIASAVRRTLNATILETRCVPDDRLRIADTIKAWAHDRPGPHLILTTGGTGLAPRDVTPEATLDVLERLHPGIVELIRERCGRDNPLAYLSRAQAGTVARSLVVNLPGSERGAVESLAAIADVLPHALAVLDGCDDHPPPPQRSHGSARPSGAAPHRDGP